MRQANVQIGVMRPQDEIVYFIQEGTNGPIKIGKGTSDGKYRLAELQTGNPRPLRLITAITGGIALEHQLHRELAEYRMHGEWFQNVKPVRERIKSIVSEPGRTSQPGGWRIWSEVAPETFCSNCGTADDRLRKGICKACREFAEVRELAAQGVDPFE